MNYIKELLFPPRCPVCDGIVGFRKRGVCGKCEGKLVPVREPWCCRCGKPLRQEEREFCYDCTKKKHYYRRGRAVFTYDSAAQSIYRFKYGRRQEYSDFYGKAAADLLADEKELRKAEALVPVPLHASRMRQRGYNQAALFAKVLGKEWGIPVREDLVVRGRDTQPLKQLNPAQRQNNLKRAFKIIQNDVKLNTIIIVDDIYTTGSTIDAISMEFSRHGVHTVYFITLAVGKGI